MVTVNYLALLAAGIANMVVGFLWYGPVFGKVWIRLMGFTPQAMEEAKKKGMGKSYTIAFIGALVMGYMVNQFVFLLGSYNALSALQDAVLMWLGFIATSFLGAVLWEGKSWKLYAFNIGYYLVVIYAQTLIFTYWV